MNENTYSPLQNGVIKNQLALIHYAEQNPDSAVADTVYCYWTLSSQKPLDDDFIYTIMPDACVDIVFDVTHHSSPIVMTPFLSTVVLNLGRSFHYMGIRFRPGVFTGKTINLQDIVGNQQNATVLKTLQLDDVATTIHDATTEKGRYAVLESLVHTMKQSHIIEKNQFIEHILTAMHHGQSIETIARQAGYSARQLRRKTVTQTGFSPVQLQRVLRFQQTLSTKDTSLRFADQSHLIKEFKKITGIPHRQFIDLFE